MNDGNCGFCDRTKFEERLIAENNFCYIVATLGQITEGGYVLLIPKEHILCAGELNSSTTTSLINMAIKIRNALSKEYRNNPFVRYPVTVFEHGIVGQSIKHAYLHFLPAVLDFTPKILQDFPQSQIEELQSYRDLRKFYEKRREPYLFWTVPAENKFMVCWNPPASPQYLRILSAEILGCPERGNWRNMDPELDKKLWQETVVRLKPYF